MNPIDYFLNPGSTAQKQFFGLRMYYLEGKNAKETAKMFGYKHRGFTTIVTDFNKKLKNNRPEEIFFKPTQKGRKTTVQVDGAKDIIIALRKKYYSVEEIKTILDAKSYKISERTIYNVIHREGYSRLPRRTKLAKQSLGLPKMQAEKSRSLSFSSEKFKSTSGGILCLLPYIKIFGISDVIKQSDYPGTKTIDKLSSILSFVALKSSNIRRYSSDDRWCMDRGLGLFAGLNVLPKASWYTSYSHRVTSDMNLEFLKTLHKIWLEKGLLGDTANLDFTTIPYWGESGHLENNWDGKRGKAMASMLSILAHDPDTGIINYGNTNVMHKNESAEVLEFLDFYRSGSDNGKDLKYLIFDSKFTNYVNLRKLEDSNVKFITIRRKGKNITEYLKSLPAKSWKTFRVDRAGNKKVAIKVFEEIAFLRTYDKQIRQINIKGHGRIKPATIILNDFEIKVEDIVRKYARRWIVEKEISEQIEFFHLNSVSSSMVIKVDFDLTMSILTHNIFKLFANETNRYKHISDNSIYENFLKNSAEIIIDKEIDVKLKKKKHLPLLLEINEKLKKQKYSWLDKKKINFSGNTFS